MDPTQPSHGADAPAVTVYLLRPEGRIAYDLAGEDGPLVVCLPGMGELRSSYRHTRPALVQAGYQVATMDLRGHGDSDTSFAAYDDVAAGTDALALIQHLGHPAVLIGNSMSAGAAVWAAAEKPHLVDGLVLIGPFVRNVPMNPLLGLVFRLAMSGPWARRVWVSYLPKLSPGQRQDDYHAAPGCHLGEPGPTRPLGSLHSDDADEPRTRRGPARRSPHAHPGHHGHPRPRLPGPGRRGPPHRRPPRWGGAPRRRRRPLPTRRQPRRGQPHTHGVPRQGDPTRAPTYTSTRAEPCLNPSHWSMPSRLPGPGRPVHRGLGDNAGLPQLPPRLHRYDTSPSDQPRHRIPVRQHPLAHRPGLRRRHPKPGLPLSSRRTHPIPGSPRPLSAGVSRPVTPLIGQTRTPPQSRLTRRKTPTPRARGGCGRPSIGG